MELCQEGLSVGAIALQKNSNEQETNVLNREKFGRVYFENNW